MAIRRMEQFDCDAKGCGTQTLSETDQTWNALPLGWGALNYWTGDPETFGKLTQGRTVLCPDHWNETLRELSEGMNWTHDH